jgi:hypothetical protein
MEVRAVVHNFERGSQRTISAKYSAVSKEKI